MKTQLCKTCNANIRKCNYNKHVVACKGIPPRKGNLTTCTFCNILLEDLSASLVANHIRWCIHNPKRKTYRDNLIKVRSHKSTIISDETKEKLSAAHKRGCYKHAVRPSMLGKKHTKETREKMSASALKSTHRRLVKSARKYICKNGTEILLDSSWEEALAKRLDELDINWVRPEIPIPWIDKNSRQHNYFPDFYLPDLKLYLDPKNPMACLVQKEKLDIITNQLDNLVILKTLEECKTFSGL